MGNNGVKAIMIFLTISFDPYLRNYFEKLVLGIYACFINIQSYVHLCIIKIMFRYMSGSNFLCFEKSQKN